MTSRTMMESVDGLVHAHAEERAMHRMRYEMLRHALVDLVEQVDSLEGYELTRDTEEYKAQACWDEALRRAREALR